MPKNKPHPRIDDGLRSLAAKLEERHHRVLRAKRFFENVADAYGLVLHDLRRASGESDPATRGEPTA
jgi:hypothetical protein